MSDEYSVTITQWIVSIFAIVLCIAAVCDEYIKVGAIRTFTEIVFARKATLSFIVSAWTGLLNIGALNIPKIMASVVTLFIGVCAAIHEHNEIVSTKKKKTGQPTTEGARVQSAK